MLECQNPDHRANEQTIEDIIKLNAHLLSPSRIALIV